MKKWKFTSILFQYTVGGSCTHEEKQSSISNVSDYTVLRPICGNLSVGDILKPWTTLFKSHNKSRILLVCFIFWPRGQLIPQRPGFPQVGHAVSGDLLHINTPVSNGRVLYTDNRHMKNVQLVISWGPWTVWGCKKLALPIFLCFSLHRTFCHSSLSVSWNKQTNKKPPTKSEIVTWRKLLMETPDILYFYNCLLILGAGCDEFIF